MPYEARSRASAKDRTSIPDDPSATAKASSSPSVSPGDSKRKIRPERLCPIFAAIAICARDTPEASIISWSTLTASTSRGRSGFAACGTPRIVPTWVRKTAPNSCNAYHIARGTSQASRPHDAKSTSVPKASASSLKDEQYARSRLTVSGSRSRRAASRLARSSPRVS